MCVCNPGDQRCHEGNAQKCSSAGIWQDDVSCGGACADGGACAVVDGGNFGDAAREADIDGAGVGDADAGGEAVIPIGGAVKDSDIGGS